MAGIGKKHGTGCAIAFGLDTFGDRWSLLVIRDLMLYGKKTYGEFLGASEGIATNVLADRLKHLEAQGIVERSRDPENRRSYIYALTEKGRDLAPVIVEIIRWSAKHDADNTSPPELLERVRSEPERLVEDLRAGSA